MPRPHHARRKAREEVPLLVAVMPQVKLVAVMLVAHAAHVMAAAMTATMAATMTPTTMRAARGRIVRSCERGGNERDRGNGSYEE